MDKTLWVNPNPNWKADLETRSSEEFASAWREHAAFQSTVLCFAGYVMFVLQRKRSVRSSLRVSTAADGRIHREFWKLSPPETPTSEELVRELTEYMEATSSFLPPTAVGSEWQVVRPKKRLLQCYRPGEEYGPEDVQGPDPDSDPETDASE
jgi:hypothetical protein